MAVRYFLWLAIGKALRLPVSELIESINIQLGAARRQRGNRKAPFTLRERMRLAELARQIGRPIHTLFRWIVSPDAMIRWLKRYQERQVQQQDCLKQRRVGRPPCAEYKVKAILQIYHGGQRGLKRIRGELRKCNIELAKSTIRRVLDQHGLPPGDNRTHGSTWRSFWRNHAAETIGIDFIQTAVGLFGKISYHFVLIAIEHDTRKTHLLGITDHPTDEWLRNVVRGATMDGSPIADRKYWVHDNDGKFTNLSHMLKLRDKRSVRTAVRAPDMNAYAERFIRSAQEECLDHFVFLSEKHLRHAASCYIEHYNSERPHQGIGNVPIGDWQAGDSEKIICDTRLNGLLKSFRCAA